MAWAFDHGELLQQSATLRSTANSLAVTRASILSRLGSVDRYSSSAASLSAAVGEMTARAVDLDARVAHLDELADRVRQQLNISLANSAVLATPPPTEEERLSALLAVAVADLSSDPGSFFDPAYLVKVGKASLLAAQLRSHREQLLRDALDNRRIAIESGATGAWVDVMRSGAGTEIRRLSATLGITREDLVGVAVAMRAGISPSDAGLPEYLFPAEYLERMDQAASLDSEINATRQELEELEAATRVAWIELREAGGILGGLLLRDSDYRSKGQAYQDALDVEQAVADRLDQLEDDHSALTTQLSRTEVHDYLEQTPFLSPAEQSRLVGDYLGGEWLEAYDDFAEPDEHLEILWLLSEHDGRAAAAFFNTLGPEGTHRTPSTVLNMFVPEADAETMIGLLSGSLGHASKNHELEFTGEELIQAMDDEQLMAVGLVDPAWLFAYGDFSDEFLVGATVAVTERDDFRYGGMQHVPEKYRLEENMAAAWDARILLMQRLADRPETSAMLVSKLDDAGRLSDVLGRNYDDNGVALGDILANLVDVNGPEGLEATVASVVALAALEADGVTVEPGVAIGASVMVAPHIDSFVPSVDRLEELGPLYIPGELPVGELRAYLDGEGVNAQATLEALMHVVLGEDAAAEIFVASMLTFNYTTLQEAADPAHPEDRHAYTNDLAGLEGLASAIWIDERLSDAADEDARNEAIKFWTGLLTSAAVTTAAFFFAPATIAGSVGAAAVAKFGVGQVINGGVKELFTNEIFPTDNVEQAQMDAITALTQRDPYGYAVLQALSDQGALVDQNGNVVQLEIDLAQLDAIDNHALGELLSTLTVIDPLTGLPSAEPEPIDWFTGGAFLTVQEITEVVGAYLDE